jgi:hypothetical protein
MSRRNESPPAWDKDKQQVRAAPIDRQSPDLRDATSCTERPRLAPMKRLDSWRWRYFDTVGQMWVATRFAMTEADAKRQYPNGAEKVESTITTRGIPDDETNKTTVAPIDPVDEAWQSRVRPRRNWRAGWRQRTRCSTLRASVHRLARAPCSSAAIRLDTSRRPSRRPPGFGQRRTPLPLTRAA